MAKKWTEDGCQGSFWLSPYPNWKAGDYFYVITKQIV